MKSNRSIEYTPAPASRRGLTARFAMASLALATATIIPTMAEDSPDAGTGKKGSALRPFHVSIPEEALVDLRRRIAATRWPEKETVSDHSQGEPLAMMQALARYWATSYDWRKCEAKLNAYPQFMTEIDALDSVFASGQDRPAAQETTS